METGAQVPRIVDRFDDGYPRQIRKRSVSGHGGSSVATGYRRPSLYAWTRGKTFMMRWPWSGNTMVPQGGRDLGYNAVGGRM